MGDETDNPIQSCPGPCDVVIPIVYYNQPITIPYSAIREEMADILQMVINVEESVKRTFTQPKTTPPLSIAEANRTGVKIRGLGHAGVAIINGVNGEVSYYEYGRYGSNYGQVRRENGLVSVLGAESTRLTISFGDNDNPTPASFSNLLQNLTKTNGGSYAFWAIYTKLVNGAYDTMKTFAETRREEVRNRQAISYNINTNHCFTFALEVASEAGVNANVSAASDLKVILISTMDTSVDVPDNLAAKLAVELPSRQMLELQKRYQALNVDQSGKIEGQFSFPERLNA